MTCLAEEFGLATTPSLRGAVVVARGRTTAATLEHRGRRLALWQKLGDEAKNNNASNYRSNEYLRRHEVSPYA